MSNPIKSVFNFYVEGFKSMKLGKTLWLIILIKLFIMFVVLRVFFFPDFLNTKFESDEGKADYVGSELVERGKLP